MRNPIKSRPGGEKKRIRFLQRPLISVLAAASVLAAVSIGAWIYWQKNQRVEVAAKGAQKSDLSPGSNKAVLVLADGRKMVLDKMGKGTIAHQTNVDITQTDTGRIAYHSMPPAHNRDQRPGAVEYNTIVTPKGGQFQVILPDGSSVWLNTASSLRFPVAFSGSERKEMLSGEAYFEIKDNPGSPFKVSIGDTAEVTVLGTSFDVKCYSDENRITTTLLKGAVRVHTRKKTAVLAREQVAIAGPGGDLRVTNDVAANAHIAWVDGLFRFNRDSIDEVMRQLARWYDVEIVFEGHPKTTVSGSISRDNFASDVLEALKESGGVNFKIQEKKIIVLP